MPTSPSLRLARIFSHLSARPSAGLYVGEAAGRSAALDSKANQSTLAPQRAIGGPDIWHSPAAYRYWIPIQTRWSVRLARVSRSQSSIREDLAI